MLGDFDRPIGDKWVPNVARVLAHWAWEAPGGKPGACSNVLLILLALFVQGQNELRQCVQKHAAATLQIDQSQDRSPTMLSGVEGMWTIAPLAPLVQRGPPAPGGLPRHLRLLSSVSSSHILFRSWPFSPQSSCRSNCSPYTGVFKSAHGGASS